MLIQTPRHLVAARSVLNVPKAFLLPVHRTCSCHNQRDMARARRKLACFASSRETGSAVARTRVPTKAGRGLEGAAGTSHYGIESKGKGLPPLQRHSNEHGLTTTRATTRRARAESWRAAPPERQRAKQRVCTCHVKAPALIPGSFSSTKVRAFTEGFVLRFDEREAMAVSKASLRSNWASRCV